MMPSIVFVCYVNVVTMLKVPHRYLLSSGLKASTDYATIVGDLGVTDPKKIAKLLSVNLVYILYSTKFCYSVVRFCTRRT